MKYLTIFSAFVVFFISVAGLHSAIAQNAVEKKSSSISEKKIIDNGYFKYEVTGNLAIDAENEKNAKDAFIAEHPEQYEKMKSASIQNNKHAIDYNEYLKMPANKRANIDANADKYYFINK